MGFGDRVRREGSNLSASASQARGPYASQLLDADAAARPGMAGICINMIHGRMLEEVVVVAVVARLHLQHMRSTMRAAQ